VTTILGLDPSLSSTGYATVVDGYRTVGRLVPRQQTGVARLSWLRRQVIDLVDGDGIDLVAIEGYSMGSGRAGGTTHAHGLGELGGVIRLALYDRSLPFADVPPASLKKFSTGKGNASKEQVLVEAVKRLGYPGSSNDEADALWLLAMASHHYGQPLVKLPQVHLDALAGVAWPDLTAAA